MELLTIIFNDLIFCIGLKWTDTDDYGDELAEREGFEAL